MSRLRLMRPTNRVAQLIEQHTNRPKPADGNGWYKITNLATGVGQAEIYIYAEIGFWGVTAAEFVSELAALEAVHIDLRINSEGGDVWDGIAIYNALCNHPASVTTHIDGLAASAASFIAQAGGKVIIARNGTMMIHDAEGLCIGNCQEMLDMAALLDRTSNNIADIYAQRCSTVNMWRKSMKNVSWYVGQEAIDSGLADELYDPEPGSVDQPAERRRRASNSAVSNQRTPKAIEVPQSDDQEPESGSTESTAVVPVPGPQGPMDDSTAVDSDDSGDSSTDEADSFDDLESWWSPELFRTAVATAADQNALYGFSADAFREIMRAAAEDCPAPRDPVRESAENAQSAPVMQIDLKEFRDALRKGLL